jgi:hypothetical protein
MLPAALAAEPSSASSSCTSMTPGSSGRARSSARRRRTGNNPSFQRPARALASATEIVAGRSIALVVARAWPVSAVVGSALANADRSSALTDASSSPSGQAARGRISARASSDCAGCVAVAAARTVAAVSSASSGPRARAVALQPFAVAVASTVASTGNGASAPIASAPCASPNSMPAANASRRWRAPPSLPRWTPARTLRTGRASAPPMRSSSMLAARTSISTGRRRVCGKVAGPPGAAVLAGVHTARSAWSESITRCSQRPSLPRPAASACQRGASRRSSPTPAMA